MKHVKISRYVPAVWVAAVLFPLLAWAENKLPAPETYMFHPREVHKIKRATDDPRDLTVTYNLQDVVPPEIWDKLHFDPEKMKAEGAKLLGFTSPALVGKIAPEIEPGLYTYRNLEKNPGLKKLFPPELLQHIKAPGPPRVCNIPEFELLPTKQIYCSLPIIEVTKRNLGKTKLDKDGYIVPRTWEGGIPFPRPSGKFKAQQVYYCFEKRAMAFNKNYFSSLESNGYDRNLRMDKYAQAIASGMRFMGRVFFPPHGWFDERAERNGEFSAFTIVNYEPRAMRGMVVLQYHYDDPDKLDAVMLYLPSLRRIRKMSATDTQDPFGDLTYDDSDMLAQKITPQKFPYKFEIIAEREYLLPYSYGISPAWVDSRNHYALRGIQFQRRPCYVLQMTQLDPNYVYSKRIFYIDKENFISIFAAYYDQKGRLYRTQMYGGITIFPEFGTCFCYGGVVAQHDYVDLHSTFQVLTIIPAAFSRKNFSIQHLIKIGK